MTTWEVHKHGTRQMDGGHSLLEDDKNVIDETADADMALSWFNTMAESQDNPCRLVAGSESGFVLVRQRDSRDPEMLLDLRDASTAFEAVQLARLYLSENR